MTPFAPQRRVAGGSALALVLAFAAATALAGSARAEPASRPADAAAAPDIEVPVAPDVRKAQRQQDLEAVQEDQRRAAEAEARLKAEIAAISEDRRTLNQALIETAARIRAA